MRMNGCRMMPVEFDAYLQKLGNGVWSGGWVWQPNKLTIFYATSTGQKYYEYDGNFLGNRHRPFPYIIYKELLDNEIWTGGWAHIYEQGGVDLFYVSEAHVLYNDRQDLSTTHIFGSRENPIPLDIFYEMNQNKTWLAGWVGYPNEEVHYANDSGDFSTGCGCGSSAASSGSGSSAGSGGSTLRTGTERYCPSGLPVTMDLLISWGEGTFDGGGLPNLNVQLIRYEEDPFGGPEIIASWDAPFRVKIETTETPDIYYNIPWHYRQ